MLKNIIVLLSLLISINSFAADGKSLYEISSSFLGMPYEADTLGCSERETVNMALESFDCVTFVEHSLALYMGGNYVSRTLTNLRYHDTPGCKSRNHFFVADWLANNSLAYDISGFIARKYGLPVLGKTAAIDRTAWFKNIHNLDYSAPIQEIEIPYIPADELLKTKLSAQDFPAESLFLIVNKDTTIDIAHVGFLFNHNNTLIIQHASTSTMTVSKEPFEDYLKRIGKSKSTLGIAIWGFGPGYIAPDK